MRSPTAASTFSVYPATATGGLGGVGLSPPFAFEATYDGDGAQASVGGYATATLPRSSLKLHFEFDLFSEAPPVQAELGGIFFGPYGVLVSLSGDRLNIVESVPTGGDMVYPTRSGSRGPRTKGWSHVDLFVRVEPKSTPRLGLRVDGVDSVPERDGDGRVARGAGPCRGERRRSARRERTSPTATGS